jgi:hypothetical protein
MSRSIALSAAFLVAVMCAAADVRAQTVEVAPFVGLGFGGSLMSPALDEAFSIKSGMTYGVTVDLPIAPMWRFEVLYSRQESRIDGADARVSLGLDVERYMVGVQEEKAWSDVRFIGTFLAGATRFVPSGYDSEFWFSVALGLGVKTFPTKRIGLRFEARGFYMPVTSGGGAICGNGRCTFAYSGSGMFQGDVSGGVIFVF